MARRLSQDRTMRRSKSGIQVRVYPQIAPPWPKLTLVGLSGRQTGAVEREDRRAQQRDHVGRVFPGRDNDCVWIVRKDDQSLGFRCAFALKIALPWPRLTLAGLAGRETGAVEREDQRAQRLDRWLQG